MTEDCRLEGGRKPSTDARSALTVLTDRLVLVRIEVTGALALPAGSRVVHVERIGEAIAVQWYQVQAVFDDLEDARALLRRLVHERITVSGIISGPIVSITWNNYVEETTGKWLVSALSTGGRVHDLVKRIAEEYQDPVELIVLPVSFGDSRYLDGLVDKQADAPI
jgi:uncharacterized protein involved in tolerance to divalent cations